MAVEPDYDGCYLLFTEARGGSFIAHWSQTELPEGSEPLAYYKPSTPVAKFKYAGGGQTEMCRGVGGPNKKRSGSVKDTAHWTAPQLAPPAPLCVAPPGVAGSVGSGRRTRLWRDGRG